MPPPEKRAPMSPGVRRDLVMIPAETLQRLYIVVSERLLPNPGDCALQQVFGVLERALDYQPPELPVSAFNAAPNEPVDRTFCARMLVSRSARLMRLIELQAPEAIVEEERRL